MSVTPPLQKGKQCRKKQAPEGKSVPPVAKKVPTERTHHGDTFVDEYEWLRDKQNQEVIDHLEAQNRHTEAHTGHLGDLSKQIFNEIKSRVKETDMSVPSRRGSYWYYSRTQAGKQYPGSAVAARFRRRRLDTAQDR